MVPVAAAIVGALVVAELVVLAVRVAGGVRPGSFVGVVGPVGPGRRLDRRDGGRSGRE